MHTKASKDEILESVEQEMKWLWGMWRKLPGRCDVRHIPRLLDISRRCDLALRQLRQVMRED